MQPKIIQTIPELLKPYIFNIINNDQIEQIMVENCFDVFCLICEKMDIDAARWFYYNWINDLSHYDFNNIIDNTIYDFLQKEKMKKIMTNKRIL